MDPAISRSVGVHEAHVPAIALAHDLVQRRLEGTYAEPQTTGSRALGRREERVARVDRKAPGASQRPSDRRVRACIAHRSKGEAEQVRRSTHPSDTAVVEKLDDVAVATTQLVHELEDAHCTNRVAIA